MAGPHGTSSRAALSVGYEVRISENSTDRKWDAFLTRVPGGHHVQTSLWGQVKKSLGWRVARIVVSDQERIVAGGQLLMHSVPLLGTVGYVTKGPLCASDSPALLDVVMTELHRLSKAHHLSFLVVQPPNTGEAIASQLPKWGFQRSWVELAPTATVLIDVTRDLDDILAQMKRQTRQNVRRSARQGIVVRERTGLDQSDLSTFFRLYSATSERQEFETYPEEYFAEMWRVLGPPGYLKLLLATCRDEAVSALLIVPFRDTVIAKVLGWSGLYGKRRPNEALFWAAIKWAKSHGYRYFDLEGIDPEGAKAVLEGRPLPESLRATPTRFKITFGGEVVLYPEPYDYVYNPLLRWAYNRVSPRLEGWSGAYEKLLDYVRRLGRSTR